MNFSILDLIFPKRCVSCLKFGKYFCLDCLKKVEFVEPVCPNCQRQSIEGRVHLKCKQKFGLDGLVVGLRYRKPVSSAIIKIKYKWIYDIEKTLCLLFEKVLWKYDLPKNAYLVPVPLHKKRLRWRGFNQAELICNYFSKKFGVKSYKILERVRNTKTQVGLTKVERKKNIKDAFGVSSRFSKFDFKNRDFILVDDVYTTGATIGECAKVLKKAGARSVWGMALALG